ncbi:MAG: DUF72 domain-containing protein [Chitinophagales bacterium]|nr:DUF72 domain-containing protein [Chitinophagales bacterium]
MSKTRMMEAYLGCSGYHYRDWRGQFYPEELPMKKWLPYYAERFNSVEINNSFYRLPTVKAFQGWYDQTPKHFLFTIKGSRYITHMKKLVKGPELNDSLAKIYDLASHLKEKLGPILWQLPGFLKKDINKLEGFCQSISKEFINVIEFRHTSWFDEEVYEIMRQYKVTFSMVSAPDKLPEDAMLTSDIAYLRFHGKDKWYDYDYSHGELETWAKKLKKLKPKQCFAYFNNDWHANAPRNCMLLESMLLKK